VSNVVGNNLRIPLQRIAVAAPEASTPSLPLCCKRSPRLQHPHRRLTCPLDELMATKDPEQYKTGNLIYPDADPRQ